MNQDRIELLDQLLNGLALRYDEHIQERGIDDRTFLDDVRSLVSQPEVSEQKKAWENLRVSVNAIRSVAEIANPYYVGYGNPNAEVLIIGKEKGFDIDQVPENLFKESVSNVSQWAEFVKNPERTVGEYQERMGISFNPRYPRYA